MKRLFRKNQLIITALVILVGIAGYLSFTQQSVQETLNWVEQESEQSDTEENQELAAEEVAEVDETTKEENVGEAVLTNAQINDAFYGVKLEREQVRAENKEVLSEILNNKNATEDQKKEAVNSMMEMSDFAEKENAAETVLVAKGFRGAVVSMTKEGVDVVMQEEKLEGGQLTQIMDIVARKTGISMDNIVISTSDTQKKEVEGE